jgi:O-antigen ligase
MNPIAFSRTALSIYLVCTLTAMAPMSLGFVVLLTAWLIPFIQNGFRLPAIYQSSTPWFQQYRLWGWILLIACWISLSAAGIFPKSYAGHEPEVTLHGYLKIWYLMIPGILVGVYDHASKKSEITWGSLLKPWWIMTVILMGIACIQFFTGWPISQPIPTNPGRYHAILFFGHHLSTASIVLFPAFSALAIALGSQIRKDSSLARHGISKVLVWAGAIAGVSVLFLSYARTAWLVLLIGLAIVAQYFFGKRITKKQWIASTATISVALIAFSQTALVKERITNLMGVSERFWLWRVNFQYFLDRPILGIGWLKNQEMARYFFDEHDPQRIHGSFAGHAHSNFFEMLGGTGLIGFTAFLAWSWFTLRLAHRLRQQFIKAGDPVLSDLCFGIQTALILFHINGLTNVNFWEGKVMHQQMLAVGLLLILDRKLNARTAFTR